MKKRFITGVLTATMAFASFGLIGCASSPAEKATGDGTTSAVSGEISVYSREDGSGTRGAFTELTGIVKDVTEKKPI